MIFSLKSFPASEDQGLLDAPDCDRADITELPTEVHT